MKTKRVLKLLAEGFGVVALAAISAYVEEEFSKKLVKSVGYFRKEKKDEDVDA